MKKINYALNKVFLDVQYEKILIELCLKNGIITKDIDGHEQTYEGVPLTGKMKLLQYLVLFEKIDFGLSMYDCLPLVEMELVSEENICCSNKDPDKSYETEAVSIMSAYRSDIIRQVKQKNKDRLIMLQKPEVPSSEYWRTRTPRSFTYLCTKNNETLDLNKDYLEIISCLDTLFTSQTPNNYEALLYNIFQTDCVSDLLGIRANLEYALQSAKETDSVFASSYLQNMQGNICKNPIDDVYLFVKTSLPNEVNILPMPKTLEDALNMRKHPAISSFRRVMSEWDYYINKEDYTAANKIKNDIIKANKYMEKLDKYKKCSSSPYVRTGYFIGGFITGLSAILNIFSFSEPYIIDAIEKKYSWTHLNNY